MSTPSGPFEAAQFTPTKWSTAHDKAVFANRLTKFVMDGCPMNQFTEALYSRLSSCFGHIAEYDRSGFAEKWFSTAERRLSFLEHAMRAPCYGDPNWTYSDVEVAIQSHLRQTNQLLRYQLTAAEHVRASEMALLASLQARYGIPRAAAAAERDPNVFVTAAIPPKELIQGFLFE